MFDWIPEQIEQAHRVFEEFLLDWEFILNPPATEVEIRACEVTLGVSLPPSFRKFLQRCNGAYLFCTNKSKAPDSSHNLDNFGIIIHGTDELVEFNRHQKEGMFTDEGWDSLIAFCDLDRIKIGDFCALDPQQTTNAEYAVLDCFHELTPAEWRQTRIASSFAEWLARIFNQVVDQKKMPEYWFEAESSSSFSLAKQTPYALIRQGLKKAQRQDSTGAITDFDRLLLLDPKNSRAYHERGIVHFALKDYNRAIEDYTQAIHCNAQYVKAYEQRGLARSELKDYQGAISDFSQALQVSPRDAEVYNHRGNVRSLLGDRQGAKEDYQKAAALLIKQERLHDRGDLDDECNELFALPEVELSEEEDGEDN